MSCKHTRDWNQDTYKKTTVVTKIVLRGHPSHNQQCYHDRLTCNVNKVYMILLISIYAFLIFMGLFPQLSSKNHISFTMKKVL